MIIVTNRLLNSIYFFLVKKWYFDLIYNNVFVYSLLRSFYNVTFKLIDRGIIEFFGPLSIVRIINRFSELFSFFQTGFLYNYIFVMLIGIVIFFKLILSVFIVDLDYFVNFKLLVCIISLIFFLSFRSNKI